MKDLTDSSCPVSNVHFAKLCFFKGFLVFEIRKNGLKRMCAFTFHAFSMQIMVTFDDLIAKKAI